MVKYLNILLVWMKKQNIFGKHFVIFPKFADTADNFINQFYYSLLFVSIFTHSYMHVYIFTLIFIYL